MNKIRVVSVDHYMAKPVPGLDELYAEFRGEKTFRVPVIRIFGVSELGEKSCLHVHGVYPYFSIPFDSEKFTNKTAFFRKLMNELDAKLSTDYSNLNNDKESKSNFNRLQPQVHRVDEFKGIQFYGYHPNQECFIKILFYNPNSVGKASELVSNRKLLNLDVNPFHSHIPYILQFFIDYNISGMNFILFENAIERLEEVDPCFEETIGGKPQLKKMTSCQVELDCRASDILNNREGSDLKTGLQLVWDEEEERCIRSGRPFTGKPTASQERVKETAKQIFKREADFLSILDKICHDAPSSGNAVGSGSSKESDELMEEFKRIAIELATENSSQKKDHVNDNEPVAGPSTRVDDEDQFYFEDVEDYQLDFDDFDFMPKESDELEAKEMSQRLGDVLSIGVEEEKEDEVQVCDGFTRNSTFTVGTSLEEDIEETSSPQRNNQSTNNDNNNDGQQSIIPGVDDFDDEDTDIEEQLVSCDTTFEEEKDEDWGSNGDDLDEVLADISLSPIPQLDGGRDDELSQPQTSSQAPTKAPFKRVCYKVNGHRVYLPPNITEEQLKQLSYSRVIIEDSVPQPVSETPVKKKERKISPPSPSSPEKGIKKLSGREKTEYLLSLCQPLQVSLPRITVPEGNESRETNGNQLNVIDVASNASTEIIGGKDESKVIDLSGDDDTDVGEDDNDSEGIFSFYENYSQSESSLKDGDLSCHSSKSLGPVTSTQLSNQLTPRRPSFRPVSPLHTSSPAGLQDIPATLQPIEDSPTKKPPRVQIFTAEEFLARQSLKGNQTPKSTLKTKKPRRTRNLSTESVIRGATQSQALDFAVNSLGDSLDGRVARCSPHEFQLLTIFSMELYVDTRRDLHPDPSQDSIRALFYSSYVDEAVNSEVVNLKTGIIVVDEVDTEDITDANVSQKLPTNIKSGFYRSNVKVTHASSEMDLITKFISVLRDTDPDIILGFEVEMSSWGYFIERGNFLNMQLTTAVSRLIENKSQFLANSTKINMNNMHHFTGRILMNLWRILRKEVTLNIYNYENCHFHVLHETVPVYSYQELTRLFNEDTRLSRWQVLEYNVKRVEGNLLMMHRLCIIPKYSTLARIYGIQLSEVFSRGSQFRVESMMLRYTKGYGYVPFSPTPRQRTSMDAPEFIPLTMEPQSQFYTDPVVVLDFQSLYPSMMIAYNYCFSTCLGKVIRLAEEGPFKFGCSSLYVPKSILKDHRKDIHVSPSGTAFVTQEVRQGVLPEMLYDILETRIMVKNAMKENMKETGMKSKSLNRLLDARQLALKLVANVTYGYTAANFSGRMPCVEIADSIVSKGKETLQRAIEMVNNNKRRWGGKVVYGDTDSLFIVFPGCSKEEAFKRGQEVAAAVTQSNPKPVKLKFERVFYPCVLLAKKRYVGYSWESETQESPEFLAKGIETVRRDTCSAASKLLEKSLKILFETKKITQVKTYVQRQFSKMLYTKVSHVQDFIFAKEFRGRDSYSSAARVPSLEITKKMIQKNPRSEPRRGQRVPYVIICGSPRDNIIDLVHHPLDLVYDPSLRINTNYYIERVIIPPLNRVFTLLKEDVLKWFQEIPHKTRVTAKPFGQGNRKPLVKNQSVISQYFSSAKCVCCFKKLAKSGLCLECRQSPRETTVALTLNFKKQEKKLHDSYLICMACKGDSPTKINCQNTSCLNLFRLSQAVNDYELSIDPCQELLLSLDRFHF